MSIQPLIRGLCPVCNKKIMNDKKTAYINNGMEFYTRFSDNSIAKFAICKDCYDKITQEQLDKIIRSQIVNWGLEISKQMLWYAQKAVHLKIIKHGKDKNAVTDYTQRLK